MGVLGVNTPGELVMWLYLAESEVSMEQGEAEIILDYLKEHNMALAVCSRELMVRDMGEEPSEYQPYSIDDAIHDVCEWNLELRWSSFFVTLTRKSFDIIMPAFSFQMVSYIHWMNAGGYDYSRHIHNPWLHYLVLRLLKNGVC